MTQEKYPESQKLIDVSDKSQEIGNFLEWLKTEKSVHLGHEVVYEDVHYGSRQDSSFEYLSYSTEELLAEYFGINLTKVEIERREILDSLNI